MFDVSILNVVGRCRQFVIVLALSKRLSLEIVDAFFLLILLRTVQHIRLILYFIFRVQCYVDAIAMVCW